MNTEPQIPFQDLGRGPAVLLVGDPLLPPECWQEQTAPLQQAGFRVVLPDFRNISVDGRLSDYGDQLIGLLNRLGLGRTVIVGLGMGGTILFDLLDRFPQRVAGVGFISTCPVADDIPELVRRGELMGELLRNDGWAVRENLLKMLLTGSEDQLPEDLRHCIQQRVHSCDRDFLVNRLKAMADRKDYTRLLKNLQLPALVIGGERDLLCHPEHSRIMAGHLSNCHKSLILETGHLPQLEQPALINRELLEFLQAIAPRSCRDNRLCLKQQAA